MPLPPCRLVVLALCLTGLVAPSSLAQPALGLTASDGLSDARATPEAHVRLAWTPTGQAGELYQVERARITGGVAGAFQVLAVRPEAATEYLDASALPGVPYAYRLSATVASVSATANGSRVLRRPTALTASDSTRVDGVALEWADLSSVEVGYVVFRGAPADPPTAAGLTALDTLGADASGFLDETADPLQTAQYCVGLLDASGGVPTVAEPLACDSGTRGAVLPPAGVAASDGTLADRVRVVWRARGGVTYAVYRAAPGEARVPLTTGLAVSSADGLYDDLTAGDGAAYAYCVTASNADGESVAVCDGGRRGELAPPTAVAATDSTSDGAVELSWADPGPDESGFRIYRQPTGGGAEVLVATVAASRTRHTDRSAEPDVPYAYCVVAIAEATVDGVSVTTESARDCDDGYRSALLAPTAFAATDAATGDEGYVELTWESASDVVQLFQVLRDGAPIATLAPFARSYRDAAGLSGVTYDYRVRAVAVVGIDPAALTQGLAPILSRATADREARAADRREVADDPDARARLDAQAVAAEATLVRDVQALLAGLGVDASAQAGAALVGGNVVTADSPLDPGGRLLRAPGSLAATTALEDRVRITWADRSAIEFDYLVRAHYTPTDSVTVAVGPNRTEWVDVGAPAGADVRYRVRAIDRDSTGASASAWVEVTGRRVLLPPGRVTARQRLIETELLVTWRDSSRAETGYVVTAALAGGTWADTTEANARQITVPIQPADFGTDVPVTVQAVAPVAALPGVPSASAPVTVTAMPKFLPPRVVTASTEYPGQVVVSWTDDSDANDGYRVVRRGSVSDTLEVTGTTAIDLSPIGPATYCVTPTHTGSSAAEPDAVCANGRTSTATVPSTGDVVTTPRVASGLNAGGFGPRYGYALSASGANAIVSAWADGMELRRGVAPDWAIPSGGAFLNVYIENTVRDGIGMASFYERSSGGWTDAQRIQIGPGSGADQRFTYGLFGWDVDIEGDVAIVGAPGPADFVTHPTDLYFYSGIPVTQATITYSDGGAYIFIRDPGTGQWNRDRSRMIRAPGLLNNQFTHVNQGASFLFNINSYVDSGVTAGTRQVCTFFSNSGTVGCTGIDPIAVSPGPVRSLGQRVALTPDWAFASRLVSGTPVVGRYKASEGWAWQGDLTPPAGFDTGGYRSLAATAGAVVMGSATTNVVHLHSVSPVGVTTAPFVIERSADLDVNPLFGAVVDVNGDLLAVGGPSGAGAVYLYRKDESNFAWGPDPGGELAPDAGDTGFGKAVTVEGEVVVVGANAADGTGVVYTFRRQPGGAWEKEARLTREGATPSAPSNFGGRVAVSGEDLIIGADRVATTGAPTGAVYFATLSTPPANVAASDGRYANRVQIKWEDRAVEEDGHRIYRRGPTDNDYVLVGTLTSGTVVFDDFDVSPGDVYTYCVASFFGEDESDTNPLGESGRTCDAGYTPPNGTISGRLATGEGAPVIGTEVCLTPGPDQAVMFDGLGGRAVVPTFGALPERFTLGAWVHSDGDTTTVSPVAGIDGSTFLMLQLGGNGDPAQVRLRAQTASLSDVIDGPTLTPGWHHLAATHDGSTLALYVDGQPAGTTSFVSPSIASGAFRIAGDADGNVFDGRIDDVRLWSKALTAAEVAEAFDVALPLQGDEPDLYAYWAVDQGVGRILTDLTAGGRHAMLQGGAEWTGEAAPLNACAVTNQDGNYTFDGIRYNETTAFRVVPTDSTRQFTPAAQTATLTPESPTENQLNFTDTSSFTVRGRVAHAVDQDVWPGQAALPAAEVQILVDGTVAGTSETDGTFAVSVRGTGEHVFEARADSLDLAFTATFGEQTFADGTAEITTTRDLDGLLFTNTTQRQLRGQAAGGCDRPIGDLTFRITTEDRLFDQTFSTEDNVPYALPLPPLAYRLEYKAIGEVPGTLDRTAVVEYFRNLGVLPADLTEEADTVDFRYRAPITLVVERGGVPFSQSTTCTAPYTVYDAEGNPDRTLPNVPVIGEYERVPLTIRAFEDYGDGGLCSVDEGTVRIFDGFADAAGDPVDVQLVDGEARYTTFGRSPDTFAGRTVDGIDRSYQKSLTAVLEVPDGPSVTTTEWAYVEGFREKPSTFVTATTGEIPLMVLRDPPGSQSSAFVEKGTSSCVNVSAIQALTLETGASFEISLGYKALLGFLVLIETNLGITLSAESSVGFTTEQSLGRDANIEICATTTERLETNGGTGWSGEDVYMGVGLNLLFALADVVATDSSNPAECRVNLSTTVATDLDAADPFETTFTYGKTHIENTLIPNLVTLARLAGGGTAVEGEIDGSEEAVSLREAIANWEGMIDYNDALVTDALAGDSENRSFSAGTNFQYGTASDTTWTTTENYSVYSKNKFSVGPNFAIAGNGASVRFLLEVNTESTFNRAEGETTSFRSGYTLADDDTGDYFTVDVAQDPRYGTYVFNTVSGASSNPWEPGTQKRDLPRLEIDPPLRDDVLDGTTAVYTLSLTNASESGERREYVIDAPAHLNPDGAVIKVNGGILSEKRYLVDADQTISIPVTVERGPEADAYDLAIIAYSPFDHAIWRTAPQLGLAVADTARFTARFTPLVAPLRLVEPEDGWAVSIANPTVQLTLGDIDIEGTPQEQVGVEYRRRDGAWDTALSLAGDEVAGTSATLEWSPPAAIADGDYELRGFARRAAAGGPPPYYGPALPGWIDRTAPAAFGAPEPADVVLALGETIGITFEEPVDCVGLRRTITDGGTVAELVPAAGASLVLDVGCADRTVLLAPQDASAWPTLEGQLVTARLKGVRDLAGNPMGVMSGADAGWDASWRFTVRRNAFGWTPALVTVRAQPGVPMEIPAALVNGRAQPVDYSLVLPTGEAPTGPFEFTPDGGGSPVPVGTSALAGTVVSGNVQPVAFRWPGAPEGTYTATIGVRSRESGADLGTAPLAVTVEVACAAPAWTVAAAAFETSMTVMAELRMAGGTSEDPADRLAAFVDGELRGVAAIQPLTASGSTLWRAPLVVYGTGAADRVVFQAWDDDACTLHRTTSQVVEFAANSALGTAASPLVVEAPGAGGAPLELPLAAGWTWISTNRTGTAPLAAALVGVGSSETDLIQSQSAFSQYTPGSGWAGTVTGLEPGRGYHLRLNAPATLTHPGALVDPTAPLDVVAGWNWIGYLPALPLAPDDALAGGTFATDDLVKGDDGFAQYIEGFGWFGTDGFQMEPGRGYQLFVAADGTLTYPAAAAASATGVVAEAALRARPVRRMDTLPEPVDAPAFVTSLPALDGSRAGLPVADAPPDLGGDPDVGGSVPTAAVRGGALGGYEHSMTVTATVDASAEGTLVAAYATGEGGEELRGLAPVVAVEALGEMRAFLLVRGTAADEAIVLRAVAPAEDGTLVPVGGDLVFRDGVPGGDGSGAASAVLPFQRDAVVGTAATPVGLALGGATAGETGALPMEVGLATPRPNPFSAAATFAYGLPDGAAVRLVVYDVLGREVAVLVDGDVPAGLHTVRLDGRALATGTYVARLTAGDEVRTRTFTIAR